MKFRFKGDPQNGGNGPSVITAFGHTFNRVDWTDVEDALAVRKLMGNSHFESRPHETGSGKTNAGSEPPFKAVHKGRGVWTVHGPHGELPNAVSMNKEQAAERVAALNAEAAKATGEE